MRYLGLDLGSKTLGISISDKTNTIASVLTTIRFKDEDYDFLVDNLEEYIVLNDITDIVLGLPKNMDNSYGKRAMITLEFEKKLQDKYHLKVHLMDERLTSVISNNILIAADMSRQKRKKVVDGMSAVIILQSFLDKERNN